MTHFGSPPKYSPAILEFDDLDPVLDSGSKFLGERRQQHIVGESIREGWASVSGFGHGDLPVGGLHQPNDPQQESLRAPAFMSLLHPNPVERGERVRYSPPAPYPETWVSG